MLLTQNFEINMYVRINANQLINVFQIKLGHTVVGANVKLLKYY